MWRAGSGERAAVAQRTATTAGSQITAGSRRVQNLTTLPIVMSRQRAGGRHPRRLPSARRTRRWPWAGSSNISSGEDEAPLFEDPPDRRVIQWRYPVSEHLTTCFPAAATTTGHTRPAATCTPTRSAGPRRPQSLSPAPAASPADDDRSHSRCHHRFRCTASQPGRPCAAKSRPDRPPSADPRTDPVTRPTPTSPGPHDHPRRMGAPRHHPFQLHPVTLGQRDHVFLRPGHHKLLPVTCRSREANQQYRLY